MIVSNFFLKLSLYGFGSTLIFSILSGEFDAMTENEILWYLLTLYTPLLYFAIFKACINATFNR